MKISDKLLCKRIGFTPHPAQLEIMEAVNSKRDITICAGVRFGKSKLCGYEAFKRLLADNQRIWIVSLTYDMAKKIFDYVVDFAGAYDRRLLKGLVNRPTPRLEVKEWNSWIECKSADNETSLMGEELDLAILDEAARMKPDIMERYIQARLSTRRGKSFVISTPFGQNYFYRRYLQTQQAEDGASFHFTSKDNPHFPQEEWDKAKRTLPSAIFQQEYEAGFLSDAAAVFRNVRNCIGDCLEEPRSGHRYVMGLDLAKMQDFTCFYIIDKDSHKVVNYDRFQKISYPLQKSRITAAARKYGATIVMDANNIGAVLSDEFRAERLIVKDFKAYSGQQSKDPDQKGNKERLIEKLASFFEEKNIVIPDDPILIGELDTFGYQMTDKGNIKYGAPEGLHDDCVTALMLACWEVQGKKRTEILKAKRSIPTKSKRYQYY